MATRRIKDKVFIRSSDMILPNVGQFPSGGNMAEEEEFTTRPAITRWVVPVDNESSLYIGFGYVNSYNSKQRNMGPEAYGIGRMPIIGQTADRPYEERQREPGDYDAVVSQGAIANRRAEHLGVQDRGVVLLRRMLAQAIQSVQDGARPEFPKPSAGMVRTYAHSVVVEVPADVRIEDQEALGAFGRRVAEVFVDTASVPPSAREKAAEDKIRGLFQAESVG
jgi:hypothetical protein